MLRYILLLLSTTSLTAFAAFHYKDNEGNLYCELVCRVDNTTHKTGLPAKTDSDDTVKVRGQWRKTGLTYTATGSYEVNKKTMAAIKARCDKMRPQLLKKDPIKGLLEDSDISGITEKKCRVHPRILTALGLAVFEVTLDPNEEPKQDTKEL